MPGYYYQLTERHISEVCRYGSHRLRDIWSNPENSVSHDIAIYAPYSWVANSTTAYESTMVDEYKQVSMVALPMPVPIGRVCESPATSDYHFRHIVRIRMDGSGPPLVEYRIRARSHTDGEFIEIPMINVLRLKSHYSEKMGGVFLSKADTATKSHPNCSVVFMYPGIMPIAISKEAEWPIRAIRTISHLKLLPPMEHA